MVHAFEHMKRFAVAASDLMEDGHVDAAAGRYSKTLFMSATAADSGIAECARLAATAQGLSLVTLEFGRAGHAKGPLGYAVAMGKGGDGEVVVGCMLTTDASGKFVLVPRDATFHFAVGADGLERRHGRPANIAAHAIRAARALKQAARRADPDSLLLEAHALAATA